MSKIPKKLYAKLRCLIGSENGQDLVEYGLAVTLIALACISGVQGTANSINAVFDQVSQALGPQQTPAPAPTPTPPPPPNHHHHGGDGGHDGGHGWWH